MQSSVSHPALPKELQAPWGTYACKENTSYEWQAGPLRIFLKRGNLEWQLAHEIVENEELAECRWQSLEQEPEEISWQKWAFSNAHENVIFEPAMPDRPLVVKTLTPTHIPAGMTVVFYVNIPMWAMVKTQQGSEIVQLTSISSVTLSDTWFGNNFEGDLCYALKTRAVRSVEEIKPQPHRTLCPILIANKANETLPLQKICVHAGYLNVYASDNKFWTNQISVNFLGKGVPSKVHYEKTPPSELKNPTLICKAMERHESNFFKTLGQSFVDLF